MTAADYVKLYRESFSVYKKFFFFILALALFIYFPINIARVFILDSNINMNEIMDAMYNFDTEAPNAAALASSLLSKVYVYMGASSFLTLFTVVGSVFLAKLTKASKKNEVFSFSNYLSESMQLFGKGIWTEILLIIIVACGLMLFVIPGLYWMILYMFSFCCVALYGFSGRKALFYSAQIVKSNLRVSIVFLIISFITRFLLDYIINYFFLLLESIKGMNVILLNIIHLFQYTVSDIMSCFFIILTVLLFLKLQESLSPDVNKAYGISEGS